MEYYENKDNLVKIAKYLKGRETIFMNEKGLVFRNISVSNAYELMKQIKHFKVIKNKMNIYRSIAKYTKIPMFSWNQTKRKEQYKSWNKDDYFKQFIKGYSFYIDFDNNGDYDLTYSETLTVSEYLDKMNMRHQVIFSGKGFHIRGEMVTQTPEYSIKIVEKLKKMFMLTTIDESIYKLQSIIKCPYTIDYKTNNLCEIINIQEFDLKKIKKVS